MKNEMQQTITLTIVQQCFSITKKVALTHDHNHNADFNILTITANGVDFAANITADEMLDKKKVKQAIKNAFNIKPLTFTLAAAKAYQAAGKHWVLPIEEKTVTPIKIETPIVEAVEEVTVPTPVIEEVAAENTVASLFGDSFMDIPRSAPKKDVLRGGRMTKEQKAEQKAKKEAAEAEAKKARIKTQATAFNDKIIAAILELFASVPDDAGERTKAVVSSAQNKLQDANLTLDTLDKLHDLDGRTRVSLHEAFMGTMGWSASALKDRLKSAITSDSYK